MFLPNVMGLHQVNLKGQTDAQTANLHVHKILLKPTIDMLATEIIFRSAIVGTKSFNEGFLNCILALGSTE